MNVYLIERGQADNHRPTVWWTGPDPHDWSPDANEAARFNTRDEAQTALEAISGPRPGYSFGRVTEHVFLDRATLHDCAEALKRGEFVSGRLFVTREQAADALKRMPLTADRDEARLKAVVEAYISGTIG